jgi:outer membrane receptor protein involved in Fe transport
MQQLGPALKAGAAQLPMVALNPRTKKFSDVEGSVTDVPGIVPSISTVWELGYQGLIGERLLVAADAWRSRETDFTSSLLVRTPLYLLGPEQFGAFLSQNADPQIVSALVQAGLSEAAAREQAQAVIAKWVQIPGGVASSEELAGGGADLLATNVNLGAVDLWGFDLSAQWWVSKAWSTRATRPRTSSPPAWPTEGQPTASAARSGCATPESSR